MKKSRIINLLIFLCGVIIQAITFINSSSVYYENGFAIGISDLKKNYDIAFSLIFVFIPIVFIMFFFSGSIQDLTHGHGKLLIVRSYSKTKLILKRLFSNSGLLLLMVLFQCAVFLFINSSLVRVENGMLRSLILYFIILTVLVMLQSLLELYLPSHNVNLILLIYSFASYYIVQVTDINPALKLIFFPSLMYGMQNGAVSGDNIYYAYLSAGLMFILLLAILCVRKFKKTDIF